MLPENSPPGKGIREGAGLESVKEGDRKQGGFKCGTTVPGQRENTRLRDARPTPGGENAENNGQLCRKGSDGDRVLALEAVNEEYRLIDS